jgi:hypothetical protein
MPLAIFAGNNAALQVYWQGVSINGIRRYDAGMGGFAVAHNLAQTTALGTSGALPCMIIVVHKGLGYGALGHYAAHPNPQMIVQGVQDMVNQLGGGPVTDVVFGAGMIGGFGEQLNYELQISVGVRAICPGARVLWPRPPQDDVWSAAYYLPLQEQVGFMQDSPGGFVGTGNPAYGITVHNY